MKKTLMFHIGQIVVAVARENWDGKFIMERWGHMNGIKTSDPLPFGELKELINSYVPTACREYLDCTEVRA